MLNHVSLYSPNRGQAVTWLIDVAKGLADLIERGVAQNALRMARPHTEIECAAGATLYDAIFDAQRTGAREESRFLLSLSTKTPLLHDLGPDAVSRFRSCEAKELPSRDGEPLVLCAISDSIAVGFPSDPSWDRDQLAVEFDELLDDGRIVESADWIDHLARSAHVYPIQSRFREQVVEQLRIVRTGSEVWRLRETAFPSLLFGPDVEESLRSLNPGHLPTVINRLSGLEISASEWASERGAAPRWRSKVSNESTSVLNDSKLRDARRFRSYDGSRSLFTWHARYGAGGRIHLRMIPESFLVEIGYIGRHLPL